jgi:predicted alpha/beta-fold hydrolase
MQLDFPPFRPHFLVRGGHLQTIIGSYLPAGPSFKSTLHKVELPDGDAIALHEDCDPKPDQNANSHPPIASQQVAILLHGLGGCRQSSYMLRCSAKLRQVGVRVFRMDLRGCGAGIALANQPLHAGRSEDVAAVLNYVARCCPEARIHLIGFSMGGNMVLKLAGELGAAPPPCLASVAAASPPIDLAACTLQIQRGLNQLYDRRFVRNLVRHVGHRTRLLPTAIATPLEPRPRRLMDFDSQFTAPLSGFADVHDYYAKASSVQWLSKISVPTLIIAATSDPIVPPGPFEKASYSSSVKLVMAPCGGHLGFVAARGADADSRWLDWRLVDWVVSHRSA